MDKPLYSLQTQEAKQAHFCLQTIAFIEKELNFSLQDKKIILAFSGGLDSTALFLFFKVIQNKFNLTLHALHLDHGLRTESPIEALHVQELCATFGIPCTVRRTEILNLAKQSHQGIEELSRNVRYAFFEEIRDKLNFDCIVTAHHLNDLSEDVLMRLIRGAGLSQLTGMPAFDAQRKLLRPFLLSTKQELKAFVQSNNLTWVEDNSNNSLDYTRNRIRHTLLPLFAKENPSFPHTIKDLWKQGETDKNYWQEQISPYLPSKDANTHTLDIKKIRKEHQALRLRIYAAILHSFNSHPESDTLFKLDTAISNKKTGTLFKFTNNVSINLEKKVISFNRKK